MKPSLARKCKFANPVFARKSNLAEGWNRHMVSVNNAMEVAHKMYAQPPGRI